MFFFTVAITFFHPKKVISQQNKAKNNIVISILFLCQSFALIMRSQSLVSKDSSYINPFGETFILRKLNIM